MSSANAHTVVVLPGDGIGLEVTSQARRVLEWAGDQDGMALNLADRHYGNEAYKRSGEVLTDETRHRLWLVKIPMCPRLVLCPTSSAGFHPSTRPIARGSQ